MNRATANKECSEACLQNIGEYPNNAEHSEPGTCLVSFRLFRIYMRIKDILSGSIDFVEEVAVAREIEQFYQAHFMELQFKIIFSLTGSSTRVQNIKTKKKNLDIS